MWRLNKLRAFFHLVLAFLLFQGLFPALSAQTTSRDSGGADHYSSRDADNPGQKAPRYYSLRNLETLRRAVSPRYIRVLDWRHYGQNGQITNKGILFTYASYRSKKVYLAGNFNNWTKIPMYRNSRGVYYYILPIREVEGGRRYNSPEFIYRYKFLVDGIWVSDPANTKNRTDDGLGAYLSEFRPQGEDIEKNITVRVLKQEKQRAERLVEFAIYLPKVNNLSLVGNFNKWNPEHDHMVKGKDGIFRLRLRLKPGEYVYKYIADGRWELDRYNPYTRFHRGINEKCSFLKIH